MGKAKIYSVIFAMVLGVVGIPIALMLCNWVWQIGSDIWRFVICAIVVAIIGIGYIVMLMLIGEKIGIMEKYEDKIKQWEAEGYNVEELKRKWGFK